MAPVVALKTAEYIPATHGISTLNGSTYRMDYLPVLKVCIVFNQK